MAENRDDPLSRKIRRALQRAWATWAAWEGRLCRLHGLTITESAILAFLHERGAQPVGRIGQSVYLSSGSITTAVGRLERRKLVVRSAWKGDKRIVLVALTNRGRDLERAMSSFRDPNLEVPLAALRPAERKTLADLLSRLCATTEKLASPPLSPSPWGRPTRYP